MVFCLFISGVAFGADAGEESPGRLVDRSVAMVCLSAEGKTCKNQRVLTQSELDFDTRVLLVQAGAFGAAYAPLDEAALRHGLDTVLGQLLETAEADKLSAFQLEDGEIDDAVRQFANQLGGLPQLERFLAAHEADGSTLAAVLARSVRTQRILDAKVHLKAQVSEAEARRYQDTHPELRGVALTTVRNKLFRDRYDELVAAELKQIRKDAKVRLLGAFAPQPSAEAR